MYAIGGLEPSGGVVPLISLLRGRGRGRARAGQ
jgi:hypothetical protein